MQRISRIPCIRLSSDVRSDIDLTCRVSSNFVQVEANATAGSLHTAQTLALTRDSFVECELVHRSIMRELPRVPVIMFQMPFERTNRGVSRKRH